MGGSYFCRLIRCLFSLEKKLEAVSNVLYERISPSAFPKFTFVPMVIAKLRPGSISLTMASAVVVNHLSCDKFFSPQIAGLVGCRTTSAIGCEKSYNR